MLLLRRSRKMHRDTELLCRTPRNGLLQLSPSDVTAFPAFEHLTRLRLRAARISLEPDVDRVARAARDA